jgi:hypothetical protein
VEGSGTVDVGYSMPSCLSTFLLAIGSFLSDHLHSNTMQSSDAQNVISQIYYTIMASAAKCQWTNGQVVRNARRPFPFNGQIVI